MTDEETLMTTRSSDFQSSGQLGRCQPLSPSSIELLKICQTTRQSMTKCHSGTSLELSKCLLSEKVGAYNNNNNEFVRDDF